MPRPLLPPRGIYIPTGIVFHRDLSPSVIHTWIQLRALAWGQDETAQLSILQLTELTGKSRSTIFGHMALLRQWGALRWRSSEEGTLIVAFPADTGEFYLDGDSLPPSDPESRILESENLDLPDPSLSSPFNQSFKFDVKERERENQLDLSRNNKIQEFGQESRKLDFVQISGSETIIPPDLDGADPTRIYQTLTKIRPNQLQRKHLAAMIHDTNIWYASVEHWLSHGWNPKNIQGILQLYQRGGPSSCRYCPQDDQSQEDSLSIIERMRAELKEFSNG